MKNISNFPEEELPALIALGDRNAFKQFYRRFSRMIYALALHITKCPDMAEDVVQEVFLKVWENRAAFKEVVVIRAYLVAICKNQALKAISKAKKEDHAKNQFSEEIDTVHSDPENTVEQPSYQDILNKAVAQLPPRRQDIFRLCKLEGWSYQNAAKKLGISAGTINDHIVKGTKTILKYLKRDRIG